MTLGKKLSTYRKLAGLTQQQLGEHLNLSAQAVSKWENDLAEPDLATLRALADLYKVSIDDLLSEESPVPEIDAAASDTEEGAESADEPEAEKEAPTPLIGFCKNCGITVNEENLGATEPVILCKKCLAAKQEADRLAAERKKREQIAAAKAAEEKKRAEAAAAKAAAERAAQKRSENRHRVVGRLVLSLVIAAIALGIFLAIMLAAAHSGGETNRNLIIFAVVMAYPLFAFVSCLFFDCAVQDVFFWMAGKSIQWPGLIFTFDMDGFMWLIGMKILFAVLGFLFGVLMAVLGIFCASAVAVFVFPYVMVKTGRAIKSGSDADRDDLY